MRIRFKFNPRRAVVGKPRRPRNPGNVERRITPARVVDGRLVLVLPRRLESPNKTLGAHWRRKQADRQLWQRCIHLVMTAGDAQAKAYGQVLGHSCVRITVERQVETSRRFIKDDDNLRFAVKHLNDALKGAGLIHDDGREWVEQDYPTQVVSADKVARTIVTLERIDRVRSRMPMQRPTRDVIDVLEDLENGFE
jgi:hypothetical protein